MQQARPLLEQSSATAGAWELVAASKARGRRVLTCSRHLQRAGQKAVSVRSAPVPALTFDWLPQCCLWPAGAALV